MPVYVQGFQVYCYHAPDCWTVCAWGSISFFLYHGFSWKKVDFFNWLLMGHHGFTRSQEGTDIWSAFIISSCSCAIQSALDNKCRAILSYFCVTKINCLRKVLMKLHWLNLGFKINVTVLTPYLYYIEL